MRLLPALPAALLLCLATPALATWPANGIVIGDTAISRHIPSEWSVSDGVHGIIVLGSPWHRATRVDPSGVILWTIDPYTAPEIPPTPYYAAPTRREITPDGAGGFWLACRDTGANLITLRHDACGTMVGGITTVCASGSTATRVVAAQPDGAGGVFVVWVDAIIPGEDDIRASHVDAAGTVTGPPNGVIVFGGAGTQAFGDAVADGVGGLLLLSPDALGATAQRLDVGLAPAYGSGARIEAGQAFALAASGEGGAFVAWLKGPFATGVVKLQRLDPSGLVSPGWPAGGAVAASTGIEPSGVCVAADGSGGAFVSWYDFHFETQNPIYDVRVTRVLGDGSVAAGWPPAEYVGRVSRSYGNSFLASVVADGAGGCYIAWSDQNGAARDVRAQHISGEGAIAPGWPAEGRPLGTHELANSDYWNPFVLADGVGGAYVEWLEFTYPYYAHEGLYKLRLTRLEPDPVLEAGGPSPRTLALARVSPNPTRGRFSVSTSLPDSRPARLELFDLAGRSILAREMSGAGRHDVTIEGTALAPGIHWLRLTHPAGVRTARLVVVH
jgi:hypothetical protein